MKYIERFQRSFQCLSLSVPKTLDPFPLVGRTPARSPVGDCDNTQGTCWYKWTKVWISLGRLTWITGNDACTECANQRVQALKIQEHYQSQDRPASQWSWLQLFQRIVASRSMVRWWQCQFPWPWKKTWKWPQEAVWKESQPNTNFRTSGGFKQQIMGR